MYLKLPGYLNVIHYGIILLLHGRCLCYRDGNLWNASDTFEGFGIALRDGGGVGVGL